MPKKDSSELTAYKKKKHPNELTPLEYKLVQYILDHPEVSRTKACMEVGYAEGSIGKVLLRPRVRAAIDHVLTTRLAKAGEESVKKAVVTKSIIEQHALEIATKGGSAPQVNALRLLAEMNGLIIQKTADVSDTLKDRTTDELEYFAIHGYFPTVDAGQSGATESQSSGQGASPTAKKPN